jgi:hypothetical protein
MQDGEAHRHARQDQGPAVGVDFVELGNCFRLTGFQIMVEALIDVRGDDIAALVQMGAENADGLHRAADGDGGRGVDRAELRILLDRIADEVVGNRRIIRHLGKADRTDRHADGFQHLVLAEGDQLRRAAADIEDQAFLEARTVAAGAVVIVFRFLVAAEVLDANAQGFKLMENILDVGNAAGGFRDESIAAVDLHLPLDLLVGEQDRLDFVNAFLQEDAVLDIADQADRLRAVLQTGQLAVVVCIDHQYHRVGADIDDPEFLHGYHPRPL